MIEIHHDSLAFSFPGVHRNARLNVELQRTLRVPDDGRSHALPPGLGRFALRHVDDYADRVPYEWSRHGGAMLPMHDSEALWLNFRAPTGYPIALKVAAGKINALTGELWSEGLHRHPQDYVVTPKQPWLDGYKVGRGRVRQFVASPLGQGLSAEEQLTGAAEWGGIQLVAYPMKRDAWERRRRPRRRHHPRPGHSPFGIGERGPQTCGSPRSKSSTLGDVFEAALDMGLGLGGNLRQDIHADRIGLHEWDLRRGSRVFLHLCNARDWRSITGERPAHRPFSPDDYRRHGFRWCFGDYDTDGYRRGYDNPLSHLETLGGPRRPHRAERPYRWRGVREGEF